MRATSAERRSLVKGLCTPRLTVARRRHAAADMVLYCDSPGFRDPQGRATTHHAFSRVHKPHVRWMDIYELEAAQANRRRSCPGKPIATSFRDWPRCLELDDDI